ncbi:GNAT family N-acetyltransferase [Stackebrandtia soli]|uniref:GNAT family N-acetyltransferase n=1 Tax=Stackebrandtia soli TaxID=1892856 RepID=UPI0039EB4AFE
MEYRPRFPVDDDELSALHAKAFGSTATTIPWARRLERHSLTWIGAFLGDRLVGFVHVCWDGGAHGFLLDTVVDPDHQRRGIGRRLAASAIAEARDGGCEWLHVDYEARWDDFYRRCGFGATKAGLLRL